MKRSGTYSTKSRQEIMKYLEASAGKTVSASDILNHLQAVGLNVSPTTVYRNLDRLYEEKKILKYVAEKGEKAVYQLEAEGRHCAEHLHLKCVRCGKIIHMDCDFMDEVREHLRARCSTAIASPVGKKKKVYKPNEFRYTGLDAGVVQW